MTSPLPYAKSVSMKSEFKICSINCNKAHYAKGYCRSHYDKNRRYGDPEYKKQKETCSVSNCTELEYIKGMCRLHYNRSYRGVPLDRPKGIKGELNPRWNGGASEYANHYEMKKVRLQVLEEEGYTCFNCDSPTKQIHHLDDSKDNHDRGNLRACCNSCNLKLSGPKSTSKLKRIYGKNGREMAEELGISVNRVYYLHRSGKLRELLPLPEEVEAA